MGAPTDILVKALRKILAALEGLKHQPVAIGDLAHQALGSKREVRGIELLIPTGEAQREQILSAARGEGYQQAPDGAIQGTTLRLRFTDAKLNATTSLDMIEATTPLHKQVLGRAQPDSVLGVGVKRATCEDLILLRAGSSAPGDRESVIELLRGMAGRIDGAYLKREAEAAGVFEPLKSAWQEARK